MKHTISLIIISCVLLGCRGMNTPLIPTDESARPVTAQALPVDLIGTWDGYEYSRPLYWHQITFSAGIPVGTYVWRVSSGDSALGNTITGYTTYRWKFLRWYKGQWNLRPTPKTTLDDAERWTLHMTETAASDPKAFGPGVAAISFIVWGPDEVTIGRVTYLRRGGIPKVSIPRKETLNATR